MLPRTCQQSQKHLSQNIVVLCSIRENGLHHVFTVKTAQQIHESLSVKIAYCTLHAKTISESLWDSLSWAQSPKKAVQWRFISRCLWKILVPLCISRLESHIGRKMQELINFQFPPSSSSLFDNVKHSWCDTLAELALGSFYAFSWKQKRTTSKLLSELCYVACF